MFFTYAQQDHRPLPLFSLIQNYHLHLPLLHHHHSQASQYCTEGQIIGRLLQLPKYLVPQVLPDCLSLLLLLLVLDVPCFLSLHDRLFPNKSIRMLLTKLIIVQNLSRSCSFISSLVRPLSSFSLSSPVPGTD